ncbi:hypothetical protein [Vibrio hepatarius]|uniref:hypothetical protein n=1 Tax=Vibrio hepatarius TaxID=171383 RepID=UPI001C0A08E5|nr:hypothetical protein [Vibrio hepatarius]MBU2895675.1 hypothetical protein [Vibrio hepatarius]
MNEFSIITKVGGYGRPVFLFDVDGVISKWFSRIVAFLKHKGLPFENENDEPKEDVIRKIMNRRNVVFYADDCSKHVREGLKAGANHFSLLLVFQMTT